MPILILFFLFLAVPSYADINPGTYTVLDHFGIEPSPNANDDNTKKYTEFLKQTQKGGTLRIHTLDPIDGIYPDWYVKGQQMQTVPLFRWAYECLMIPDIRGNERTYYPNLAKSITLLPDRETFRFDLRDDVHFSDGSLMTADDAAFSWKHFIEETRSGALADLWKTKVGNVKFKVISKTAFEVVFEGIPKSRLRDALFWFAGDFAIIKPAKNNNPNIQLPYEFIGTGPYEYVEGSRKDAILKRRKDYWNTQSPLYNFDEVRIQTIRDVTVVREAFMAGDLNYYEEPRMQSEEILDKKLGVFVKQQVDQPITEIITGVLYINTTQNHTKDLRFRKAMSLLYDDDFIFKTIYASSYSRQPDLLTPSIFAPQGQPSPEVSAIFKGDPQEELLNQPIETSGVIALNQPAPYREKFRQALQLLREAGYEYKNQTLTKNGQPVELEITYRNTVAEDKALMNFKTRLKEAGINLVMRPGADSATFVNDINKNNYNFALIHLDIPRKMDVMDFDTLRFRFGSRAANDFAGGNGSNVANFNNPLLDSLIDKLENTDASTLEYRNISEAAMRILSVNVPYILLGEKTKKSLYTVKGMCLPPLATSRTLEAAYFSPTGTCP